MSKRVCLTASLALLVSFAQMGFVCSPNTVTHSAIKTPSPPHIEGLEVGTASDIEACVTLLFSDTNTMDVTYNVYRKGPADAEFKRVIGGQGIPGNYTFFKDRSVFNGITYSLDINAYVYRLYAVSADDSVSAPSNADTLLLARPADITLATLDFGYPFIQYTITGQHGKAWRVDITRGDRSVDSAIYNERFGDIAETTVFPGLPVDTLRAIAQRDSFETTVFGVRIISWSGETVLGDKTYGIAVSQIDAGP